MIFNLFQRPDKKNLATYDLQRRISHELKLQATIFVGPDQYNDKEIIDRCIEDRDVYGDELGIWLCPAEGQTEQFVWLLTKEDKKRAVKAAIDGYIKCFGVAPKSIGNYVMDADLIEIIKDYCPEVTACVAGCFEEGVKVFHGCNNSWYLFSEGMSWNPWYPSKGQSVRPADSEEDWSGIVAVPHLSRDLVFGYESRNDFFASHPANVQRGLANDGIIHDYDFNLVDQYRLQEDYNDGFSYYQIHVGAGWLSHHHNIIDPDEITQALYRETLEYMAQLCKEGKAVALSFSEFAEEYKRTFPIGKQTVGIGKDILMDSGKQYYWVFDTNYRALVDAFQGGSIGDLRPYAGKYDAITGPEAANGRYHMNSYPYLIHSQYRSGYKNHYEDGARTTLKLTHAGETLDLCAYNTRIEGFERTETSSTMWLAPVDIVFDDGLKFKLQTVYKFLPDGKIEIIRKIFDSNDASASVELQEYVKACYGFTEYAEDMKNIELKKKKKKVLDYTYNNTNIVTENGKEVAAVIPQITTEFKLGTDEKTVSTEVSDGHLFSPYYVMKLNYNVTTENKEVASWLQIKKTQA